MHHDAAVFEGHDLVADAVEEVAVVGDADDGAFEDGEGFFQHAEGGEVEVVGGLVENDEVAAVLEDLGEHEAGAFATGEEVDALVDAVVAEEETFEVGAGGDGLVAEEELVAAVGDFVEEGAGAVELHPALVDVVNFDALAENSAAGGGLDLVEAKLEEGGLAGAVAAHDAGALAGAELEVEVAEEPTGNVFGAHVDACFFELDNHVAETGRRGNEEVHLGLDLGGVLVFDIVESIETTAGFGGARFDAGADPLEFFLKKFLALFLGVAGDVLADRFGLEEGGVVAGVGVGFAAVNLDDAGGDGVEEVAVVSDEDDRSGEAAQGGLEPADRFGVEVVGGLV